MSHASDDSPIFGAAWALVSAMSYSVYLVLLKKSTGNDSLNLPIFFGFVGMFIMLMFWPGLGNQKQYKVYTINTDYDI